MSEISLNQAGFLEYIQKNTHTLKHTVEVPNIDGMLIYQNTLKHVQETKTSEAQKLSNLELAQALSLTIDFRELNFNHVYALEYKKDRFLTFIMFYEDNYYLTEIKPYMSGTYIFQITSSHTLDTMYQLYQEKEMYTNFLSIHLLDINQIKDAQTYFIKIFEKEKLESIIENKINKSPEKLKI